MGNTKPMTPLQYQSHAEQMQALRAAFQRDWQTNLLPLYQSAGISPRTIAMLEHSAWGEWRELYEPKDSNTMTTGLTGPPDSQ